MEGGHVSACCALLVVEWRGKNGMVNKCWEPIANEQSQTLHIDDGEGVELVIMAACGKIRKTSLPYSLPYD